jgi:hypothetical protein
MRPPYFVLQVCLKGHLIQEHFRGELNEHLQTPLRGLERFCSQCGSKTIAHCPNCHREIRNESLESLLSAIPSPTQLPSFCIDCGSPYPWVQWKIDTISGLIDQAEGDKGEAQDLKDLLPSIVRETSETPLAIARWKGFLNSVVPSIREAFIKNLAQVGLEIVLKKLGLK